MVAFVFYPWLRFGIGLLAGCWIGAGAGLGITLMLAGRRIQQLEEANLMLRAKLRAREKTRQPESGAAGPVLVLSSVARRPASAPIGRVAAGR
jgi:hypothetical protein